MIGQRKGALVPSPIDPGSRDAHAATEHGQSARKAGREVRLITQLKIATLADMMHYSMVRGEVHLSLLRDSLEHNPDPEIEFVIKEHEVALDKDLLQLVQGACKADNLLRALDVARLMLNPATIEAAGKVAAFYHLPGLQERIQSVKADKEMARVKAKRIRREGAGQAVASSSKGFSDFAPRHGGPRRSFGGVRRDSTPVASGRSETYIPETPGEEVRFEDEGSPEAKRKRLEETPGLELEDFTPDPKKRPEELPLSNGRFLTNPGMSPNTCWD